MFFVAHVKVCINVGGGRDGRVPEEFGHLNQFSSIAEKDACEGMAKIMEPNVAQSVLFEQESVVLCHIIRSEELTELVGADEVIVLSVVAAFEHLFVQFLAFLYFKESFYHFIGDDDGSVARFVFHLGYHLDHVLIVDGYFHHL